MGLFDHDAFRRYLSLTYAKSTAYETRRKIRQAVEKEGLIIDRLVPTDSANLELERYLAAFRETHSASAFNQQVRALNRVLDFLGHETIRARKVPEAPQFPKALPPDRVDRLVRYRHAHPATSRLYRALIGLGLTAGLRRGEYHRANASDLDVPRHRLHIPRPSKRGMVRWIPLPKWLFAPKRPLMAYLRAREGPHGDRDALFVAKRPGGHVRRVTEQGVYNAFARIGRDVGFRVNPTILRHTLGTTLMRSGYDIQAIQLILGHKKITSTVIYARMLPEDVEVLFRRRPRRDVYQGRYVEEPPDARDYLPDPYDDTAR